MEWDEHREPRKYEAIVMIHSHDRNFLLTDLVTVISQCRATMQKINSTVNQEDLIVTTRMTLLVDNLEHLNLTLANLRKVSHVVSVERVIQ